MGSFGIERELSQEVCIHFLYAVENEIGHIIHKTTVCNQVQIF